jgi:hypothetical protein
VRRVTVHHPSHRLETHHLGPDPLVWFVEEPFYQRSGMQRMFLEPREGSPNWPILHCTQVHDRVLERTSKRTCGNKITEQRAYWASGYRSRRAFVRENDEWIITVLYSVTIGDVQYSSCSCVPPPVSRASVRTRAQHTKSAEQGIRQGCWCTDENGDKPFEMFREVIRRISEIGKSRIRLFS